MPFLAAVLSRSFTLVVASRDIVALFVPRNPRQLRFVKHAMDRSSFVTSDFCSSVTLFIERLAAFVSSLLARYSRASDSADCFNSKITFDRKESYLTF